MYDFWLNFRLMGGSSGWHRQQTGSSILLEKLWTKILVEPLSRTELSQVSCGFLLLSVDNLCKQFGPRSMAEQNVRPGPKVIKLEYSLKLQIKRNDWLLADTCPQAANHCTLF